MKFLDHLVCLVMYYLHIKFHFPFQNGQTMDYSLWSSPIFSQYRPFPLIANNLTQEGAMNQGLFCMSDYVLSFGPVPLNFLKLYFSVVTLNSSCRLASNHYILQYPLRHNYILYYTIRPSSNQTIIRYFYSSYLQVLGADDG